MKVGGYVWLAQPATFYLLIQATAILELALTFHFELSQLR